MDLWSYKRNYQQDFLNYHFGTINLKEFTPTQQYVIKELELTDEEPSDVADSIQLNYKLTDNPFEQVLIQRRSYPEGLYSGKKITSDLLSQFCQIAFIGNNAERRNYPSGGSLYPVEINVIFNPDLMKDTILNENVGYINFKEQRIDLTKKIRWNQIESAFLLNTPIKSAQIVFALSIDIENISNKYMDISYKLVQQEAGHIGQNIQLTAQYLGFKSIPIQGYNDIELSKVIGNRQTVLSTILLG